MDKKYFDNEYSDYSGGPVQVDQEKVRHLIGDYVETIIENTRPGTPDAEERGDLYVGNGGIAYMFWKISKSDAVKDMFPAMKLAEDYINHAKSHAVASKKRADERCAFLCGNAGIYAVSAVISSEAGKKDVMEDDLKNFSLGFDACQPVAFTKYGCDEVLVGRAGFLSGCYWLRDNIEPKPFMDEQILAICKSCVESGRQYAHATKAPLPLMYQYHGTEYLGAAHGLCAILHMLLDSPWFGPNGNISNTKLEDIKKSIDFYVSLQDQEGNFPVALEDLKTGREKRLVHWCHGAPGAIYLLIKAYLQFKSPKYLEAAARATDLIWKKGLLRKGPGICHGVAGNGYAFLVMYRLTNDDKYLYRACKFMDYLSNPDFKTRARIPDRPFSLYEGVAGTVCFLIDLLEPSKATFPFMEVFH
uniref:LanC-like protein 3 homolog n=1 Tax=Tabanus bromius TaxID=304241 RepID=A0A0K8TK76_TABBR